MKISISEKGPMIMIFLAKIKFIDDSKITPIILTQLLTLTGDFMIPLSNSADTMRYVKIPCLFHRIKHNKKFSRLKSRFDASAKLKLQKRRRRWRVNPIRVSGLHNMQHPRPCRNKISK